MKFLLAGYFGFGNFGDEAILKYAFDILRFYYKNAQIEIVTQYPYLARKNFGVDGIYRFDIKKLISAIKSCDYLIFPGGSVLQDVTSLKSILYYLGLIFCANLFKRKVILLAQGVGPINNKLAQNLTYKLLKKAELITIRDEKSFNMLKNNGVSCELTADMLWAFTQNSSEPAKKEEIAFGEISCSVEKKKIGIQLRKWSDLTNEKLYILAKAVLKNFVYVEYDYKLICLQKNSDEEIMVEFGKILHELAPEASIELYVENDIEKNIELLQQMDYMIAMRFHACLCAINAEKAVLTLSYDQKTEEFCHELGLKYIDVRDFTAETVNSAMLWLKEFNPTRAALKTNILVKKSQQNVDFLVKVIK